MNPVSIHPNLFKAAAAGNAEPFKKDIRRDEIESLLTAQTKNTILHINITSRKRKNVSTKFIEEILEICPSLLLKVNAKGDTPLQVAAKFGHSDIAAFQKLLEKKEGLIQKTDYYGWTPIHYAAYHDQYQQIRVLLEIDQTASNIADKDRKMTALHLAAGQGHARTVETILSLSPECYELVDNRGWNFKT
ncbi:hypothetical protein KPL70_026362 [Citrus sinensis]|uniref:Uncharacterized protein n=1 Tax=Citrus clementina TaxID=85681 RepID=V4S4L0_CITCL|nr:hypothetical protein CICLE_v10006947mg [Citrus x clementina]KAH9650376.1 hypothetical protein KPL70_026362 [Citrus sinensis]